MSTTSRSSVDGQGAGVHRPGLSLPKAWSEDRARCRAARVPEQVGSQIKPQPARVMLERVLDAGVPASWVTADEVYGQDPALRGWLGGRRMAYVPAIQCSELLAVGDGPAKLSAAQLAAAVPAEHWVGASAGHGAKGRRLYDWTRIQLAPPAASGWQRWLLVRRSRRDGELAFYACFGLVDTSLVGLVRVAGIRWAIEDGFQQAKNEVGLTLASTPPGPSATRTLPAMRMASAAGVLDGT
jgi:SRSO17 transposase